MLGNEKYTGDILLQKGYIENHLTHKHKKNDGSIPTFFFEDHHDAIVSREVFRQASDIFAMRKYKMGGSTYPYGERLKCPHCGKPLTRWSFSNISIACERFNAAWGCFGEGGCGQYMVLEPYLNEVLLSAHHQLEREYDAEEVSSVEYYWLDEEVDDIILGKNEEILVVWKDGQETEDKMEFRDDRQRPSTVAEYFRDYLQRVESGEIKRRRKYMK